MKKLIIVCCLVLCICFTVLAEDIRVFPENYPIGYCLPDPNPEVGPEIYWCVIGYTEEGYSIVRMYVCPEGYYFDFETQQIVRYDY